MELKGSKTEQNLLSAFTAESRARNKYTLYAAKAKQDGYEQIAAIFEETANNEKEHEERFKKLISNIENSLVFSKDSDVMWICRNCGHVHFGKEAPQVCPVCQKEQGYFMVKASNY